MAPDNPESLSAADLAEVLRAFAGALAWNREAINRLNVYPVPDGDTGTNMALTVDAVVAELPARARAGPLGAGGEDGQGARESSPARELAWEEIAKAMSYGSLMGARGNSGVILSQLFRGFAGVLAELGSACCLGPAQLVRALRQAAEAAYSAVGEPVEGTMLTLARAAAEGAELALAAAGAGEQGEGAGKVTGPTLSAVAEAARQAAAGALAGTTEQLPALKSAGVVDAGAAGLLLFYEALAGCARGALAGAQPAGHLRVQAGEAAGRQPSGAHDLRYEVMFLLEAPDEAMPAFREVWAGSGGSIAIVGGDGLYNCHIHTDDIGAAIEAAIEIGRPRQIRVTDLAEQVEEERWVREAAGRAPGLDDPPSRPIETAVVAVSAGEGVKRIFRSLGARQFVAGGQGANPSVAELVEAIRTAPAEGVVVLPNNPNVVPVAERAASNCAKKARVVPTTGIAEGFAALLAYDPQADVDANADAMAVAAARAVAGEVAQASRSTGTVREGDWLGLCRQEVKVAVPAEAGPAAAAISLLGVLVKEVPSCEMVTVIEGEGATPAATRKLVSWVSEHLPGAQAEVHHGGQPLYAYVLSVE